MTCNCAGQRGDIQNVTPLHIAAQLGSLAKCQIFLAAGVDTMTTDCAGHMAAVNAESCVREYLDHYQQLLAGTAD